MAYNTARSRLDEIVAVLDAPLERDARASRQKILDRLASGDISFDEALNLLKT